MTDPEPLSPLLQVRGLKKHFPITKGLLNRVVGAVKAVDGVSFDVFEGECLGLVGESGSGKTTVGRCILRALDPTAGEILFRVDDDTVDVARADFKQLKELRRHMQLIFQDPYASLNPRMTVFDIVGEPLFVNGMKDRSQRETRVRELLAQVGLNPQHLPRYPHAFSGGQRQRIGIARGLALNPRFIVADEPVSALDVSVQAQILNLLGQLQRDLGLTYSLHRPRSERRASHLRSGRGDVCGPHCRAGRDGRDVPRAAASVYAQPARCRTRARSVTAAGRFHRRGGGGSGQPSAGLCLSSALPPRPGSLPVAGARPASTRGGPLGELSPG
jgi:ABC-type dipeptide/oligopeptide/nickel transport system ATPase subunit